MPTEDHAKPVADSKSKAVIFTNFGGLEYGNDRREFEARRTDHSDHYRQVIKSYLQCNAESNRIAIVFAYVNWAVQQEVVTLTGNADKDSETRFTIDAKLLRQEAALIDLLRMAEHDARKELGLSRGAAPIFHYIGIRHLLDLLNNLIEVDKELVSFLRGEGGRFTYDSPKFVEAVVRLARGSHPPLANHPIIRIDEDAQINSTSINLLLDQYEEISLRPYFFFSGTYGSYTSFKITDQSLANLNPHDVPTDICEKLKALEGRQFVSESAFSQAVQPILGEEQTNRYKSSLLKHLRFFRTFRITDESLSILKSEGFTKEIITKAAKLKGLLFQDGDALVKELTSQTKIGGNTLEKLRSAILKSATVRDGNYDPVNDHAVRVHWFVDTANQAANVELTTKFLADLNEIGATQALNSPPRILNSDTDYSSNLRRLLSNGRQRTLPPMGIQPQVISGAGLTMSVTAIHNLPPFMNFKNLTIWVDDHLKRRLHEALEHLPSNEIECVTGAKIEQDRHIEGIKKGDISWAENDYFDRLLRGCLSLRLITDLNGKPTRYSKVIEDVVRGTRLEQLTITESADLRKEMMLNAQERYDEVLECWKSPEFSKHALFHWAKSRPAKHFKLTTRSLKTLQSEGISQSEGIPQFAGISQPALDKLNVIKEAVVVDEREFIKRLESLIADDQTPGLELSILKHAQVPERFKITDDFLRAMEAEGLPKEFIKRLKSSENKNREFKTRAIFIHGIRKMIGDEQTASCKTSIVKHARQSAHRQQTCADVVHDALNYIDLVLRWHIFVGAIQGLPLEGNYWLFDEVD